MYQVTTTLAGGQQQQKIRPVTLSYYFISNFSSMGASIQILQEYTNTKNLL
jgi:hypothetical protein